MLTFPDARRSSRNVGVLGSSDASIRYHRRSFGRVPNHFDNSLSPISSLFKLKRTTQAPGVPQLRGKATDPVQRVSAACAFNFSKRVSSGKSCKSADEISTGAFSPRTAARTLCSCTVPVTRGKEKPEELPEMFPAHDPAICNFISAAPSTLAFTAGKPSRLARRKVRDTSPSPRIAKL